MRKMWLVMMMSNETPCSEHEAQIQENSQKISALETRADYKDRRINELNAKMDKIENKIDNLTETVNGVIVNSIKDDNDLKERVIQLETQYETQNEMWDKFKEQARKDRDEDRQKTNLRIAYIGIGLTVLSIVLAYVIPHIIH